MLLRLASSGDRRHRWTIRRLLTGIAVLATLLGLGVIGARWLDSNRQLARHEELAALLAAELAASEANHAPEGHLTAHRHALAEERLQVERYRRATRRPWAAIEPEPRP